VSARAHTTGDDALWLGHAWVDGRHGQADLNALVARRTPRPGPASSPAPGPSSRMASTASTWTATARDWAQYQAGWNKPSVR
jgi:hypothetical protein